MDKINLLDADPSEIETIKAIAGYLKNYCVLMRPLDSSPEALALQLLAAKLGPALLKKIGTQTLSSVSNDMVEPKPIAPPDPYQLEVDYYEILNPEVYLKFKTSDPAKKRGEKFISLIDHPLLSKKAAITESESQNLITPTLEQI